MKPVNTPTLETERVVPRRFTADDLDALFRIYSDKEGNTSLPWFSSQSMDEAKILFEKRYAETYRQPRGYKFAVCLKADNVPIGYIHASMDESHDSGYGLCKAFWHKGDHRSGQSSYRTVKRGRFAFHHDTNNPRQR